MSYFDDNEDMIIYGHLSDLDTARAVTCKRCGKRGLEWSDQNGNWRLLDKKGRTHVCDTSASPSDFDDLTAL